MTGDDVVEEYRRHLIDKGNKPVSIGHTTERIRRWVGGKILRDLTAKHMAKYYRERAGHSSVDTHRNELAEVKTFFRWVVGKGYMSTNPVEGVKGIGRRRKGKKHLRWGEAVKFDQVARELARKGDAGALAAATILATGLRASELLARTTRDVDTIKGMTWLVVDKGKTRAAARRVVLDAELGELFRARATGGYLFPADSATGYRTRTWLIRNVRRVCDLAGVPYVCPHGLRGTTTDLATVGGATEEAIAKALGHTTAKTTRDHYMDQDVVDLEAVRRARRMLGGGE